MSRSTQLIVFGTLTFAALSAHGQAIPKGTAKDETVSKGKTEVTSESFQSAAAAEKDAKDATELTFGAGSMLASGNAKQMALTATSNYRLRRGDNQFTMILAGNYSRAAVAGRETETTVENLQGRTRYDRFFAKDITAFLGLQGRRDRFAGLLLRMQVDPGFGYYFVNTADRIFWAEAGYDLLHDVRREDARIPKDAAGAPDPNAPLLAKTQTVHSGRAFLGFKYKVSEGSSLSMGLEFLQGISDSKIRRLNGDATVTAKFTKSFSVATSFLFRYDNQALPGKEQLDTITSVNLVYTLF